MCVGKKRNYKRLIYTSMLVIGSATTQLWKLFRALFLFTVLLTWGAQILGTWNLLGNFVQLTVRNFVKSNFFFFVQVTTAAILEVPVAGSVLGIGICTGTAAAAK